MGEKKRFLAIFMALMLIVSQFGSDILSVKASEGSSQEYQTANENLPTKEDTETLDTDTMDSDTDTTEEQLQTTDEELSESDDLEKEDDKPSDETELQEKKEDLEADDLEKENLDAKDETKDLEANDNTEHITQQSDETDDNSMIQEQETASRNEDLTDEANNSDQPAVFASKVTTASVPSGYTSLNLQADNPVITACANELVNEDGDSCYPFSFISIKNPSGEYANGGECSFGFSVALDDSFLAAVRENEEEVGNTDEEGLITDTVLESMTPITAVISLSESLAPIAEHIQGTLTSSSEKVGTYEIILEDGMCKLKILFDKIVYNKYGVTAGATATAKLNVSGAAENDKFEVFWDTVKNIMDVVKKEDTTSDQDKKEDYQITKSAPDEVEEPSIEYTINVTANNEKSLAGMKLVDDIPTDLCVQSAKIADMDLSEQTSTDITAQNEYKITGTQFIYTFPENYSEKSAEFKITMALTKTVYETMLKSKECNKTYKNTAKLMESDGTTPKATSQEVSTNMNIVFFDKNGTQNSVDRSKIDWTLEVNASGIGILDTYVVDRISASSLKYVTDEDAIKVISNSGTQKVSLSEVNISEKTEDEKGKYSYENLIAAGSTEAAKRCSELTQVSTEAVYYKSGTDYIFILPYNYQGNVQIKYKTSLITVKEDFENEDNIATKNLENDATMFWRYKYGTGPNPSEHSFIYSINKGANISYDLITKSAGIYDEKTQTMKWKLKTNAFDIAMGNVVITDTIPAGQELDKETLQYAKKSSSTYTTLPQDNSAIPAYPSYSVVANDDGITTLTIHCGDFVASDYYQFRYDTKITDTTQAGAEILASQGESDIKNKVEMKATIAGTNKSSEQEVKKTITNTLIKKKVVSKYDAVTHKIEWQTTVNPNHIQIDDGKIIDELPANTSFEELTGFEVISEDGKTLTNDKDELTTYLSDGVKSGTENKAQVLTWTYNDTNKTDDTNTYILKYTTTVSEEYRKTNHSDTTSDNKFINTAKLTGTVGGQAIHDNEYTTWAQAQAETPVNITAINKKSVSNKDGRIKWTIVVNTGQTDMSGMKITDDMSGMSDFIQLQEDSFSIHDVTAKSDGSYSVGDELDKSTELIKDNLKPTKQTDSQDITGFTFNIPIAENSNLGKTTFAIVYYTFVEKDISSSSNVANTVSLGGDSGSTSGDSSTSTETFSASVTMDDYATMKGIPVLRIHKSSDNGTLINIADAQYKLTAYTKSDANSYNTSGKAKTKTTNGKGKIVFTNLKYKVLYSVEETAAPSGYALDASKYYYMFIENDEDKLSDESISLSDTTSVKISDITYITVNADTTVEEQSVKDTPNLTIFFTKQDEKGKAIADCEFTLKRSEWNNLNASAKTAKSDDSGKVSFDKVDPGTYTLEETSAPELYKKLTGGIELEVTSDGKYKVTSSSGTIKNALITANNSSANNNIVIKNLINKANITFTKCDNNHEILSGIKFTLQRKGKDEVNKLYDNANSLSTTFSDYKGYPTDNSYKSEQATDAKGQLTFENLIQGDYQLVETLPSNEVGNESGATTAVLVTFSVDVSGKVTNLKINGNPVTTKTPTQSGTVNEINNYDFGEVLNTIRYAYIDLKKVSDEQVNNIYQPLEGTTFAVYRTTTTDDGKTYTKEAQPYITGIKTDISGNIVKNNNDSYGTEEKFLTYGTYELVETAATAGFRTDNSGCQFKIDENTTGHEGTAWFSYNTSGTKNVEYYKSTATINKDTSAADKIYINKPVRYSLTLNKTDYTDNTTLSGAVFTIYSQDDKPIAALTQTANSDKYSTLTVTSAHTTIGSLGNASLAFIKDNKLLAGTYKVKETTVPNGYYATNFTLTIKEDGTMTTSSASSQIGQMSFADNTLTSVDTDNNINVKDKRSVKISFVKTDKNEKPLSGAKFELTCTTQDADQPFADRIVDKINLVSDSQGKLQDSSASGNNSTLEGVLIAGYTYKLKETKGPDGYEDPFASGEKDSYLTLTPADDGTITIAKTDLDAAIDGLAADVLTTTDKNNTIKIQNDNTPLKGSITLIKTDGETKKELKGVGFTLYKKNESTSDWEKIKELFTGVSYTSVTQTTFDEKASSSDGTLVISSLSWGDYKLVETKAIDGYRGEGISKEFNIAAQQQNFTWQISNDPIVKGTKLGIENDTVNPAAPQQTNVGGKVNVITGSATTPNKSDNDLGHMSQTSVCWVPDENWQNSNSYTVEYYNSDNIYNIINVDNYLDSNGNVKPITDSCYDGLKKIFKDASISKTSLGVTVLTLASNADNMPLSTIVHVKFAPTLAVKNTTKDYEGGTVNVAGGKISEKSDGIYAIDGKNAYKAVTVAGQASNGYEVDIDNLVIANLRLSSNDLNGDKIGQVSISPKDDGTFSSVITTQLAQKTSEITVSGKIVTTKDDEGRITNVSVTLNELPVPIEIGIPFIKSQTKEKLITISGTKTWADDSDYFVARPQELKLTVTRADQKSLETIPQITWIKDKNVWKYEITGLKRYDKGAQITYIVTEEKLENYHTQSDTAEEKSQETRLVVCADKSESQSLDDNKKPETVKVDSMGNVTNVNFTNVTDASLRKLGIVNDTQNPSSPERTNIGGKVVVVMGNNGDPNDPDMDIDKLNQVTVAWTPDENWGNGSIFTIEYYDSEKVLHSITVKNYIDENGNVKPITDECYDELKKVFPDASISMDSSGKIILVLAKNALDMPLSTTIYVQFVPTLAVKNITKKYAGGTVLVEGGVSSAKSDGILSIDGKTSYNQKSVTGYAAKGYEVDVNNLMIANLRLNSTDPDGTDINEVPINMKKDGTFSLNIATELAGADSEVTITGKVTSKINKNGKVTSASVVLDKLPIPLEIGIPFVTYKNASSIDKIDPANPPTKKPADNNNAPDNSNNKTDVAAPSSELDSEKDIKKLAAAKTRDEAPVSLFIMIALIGVMMLAIIFTKIRKSKNSSSQT